MKNLFVILVKYEVSFPQVEQVLQSHRDYLKKGYDDGFLLASGPQNPLSGGLIIGKFDSKQSAESFTKNDPFYTQNIASYSIIEFSPVLHSEILKSFLCD